MSSWSPLPAWGLCPPSQLPTPTDGGKDRPVSVLSAWMEESSEGRWAPCDFRLPLLWPSPPYSPFPQCVWALSSGFLGTPTPHLLYELAPAREGCWARGLPSHPGLLVWRLGWRRPCIFAVVSAASFSPPCLSRARLPILPASLPSSLSFARISSPVLVSAPGSVACPLRNRECQ